MDRKQMPQIVVGLMPMLVSTAAIAYYFLNFDRSIKNQNGAVFAIIILSFIAQVYLHRRFFPEQYRIKQTHISRLESCELRKKKGQAYCGVCPDGYKCAAECQGAQW